MPALAKPPACQGCPLDERGSGFATAEGPTESPLLFVGEALGKVESLTGRPFVGDAGGMLQRLLNLLGWDRASIRIHNAINCRPPNDWMDERAPWYYNALNHCRYLDATIAEGHQVIVPLGQTALKRVLGLIGHKKIRIQDFHGTVSQLPSGQFVVPSFHPSFLQRGAHNLIGTVVWDLQQADRVAREGKPKDPAVLYVDPPVEQFRAWVSTVCDARQQDPFAYPITSDVETPDKAGGRDEGEITADDVSYQILRQNVTCHPDEGWTVPHVGPYIEELRRLYASPGPIWEWNREYDFARQVASGVLTEEDSSRVIDLMWLWHFLQSDLPRGLGFVAPFYSSFGAWKHLASSEPAWYGSVDALQNHRCGFGIYRDLQQLKMFDRAMRHTHLLHTAVLRPAQLVGVKIDRQRLTIFKAELIDKARAALARIEACVPEGLRPLTPKQGLVKKPLDNVLHVNASVFTRKGAKRKGRQPAEIKQELYAKAEIIEKLVIKQVWVCGSCGAVDVVRRHACRSTRSAGGTGATVRAARPAAHDVVETATQAPLRLEVTSVTRYFWREPFNPDSPQQVLSYLQHRQHAPGKAKHTHKDTTNRETLDRLARTTKDPFYAALLDYRAVNKVKGTYVEGTERRLDGHDRLHPQPSFKPSTHRLSYLNPNITNVVADKGGQEGLAAGFRKCVVAGQEPPAWLTEQELTTWAKRYGLVPTPPWIEPGINPFATKLLEVDFSAIEAVLTGWKAHDREYVRLAKLGVHAAFASHVLGKPYDTRCSDAELSAYFAEIKAEEPETYDGSKRFIHGRSYGLTTHGMTLQFPHLFPTKKVADRYAAIFAQMAPKVAAFQRTTQLTAHRQKYLGRDQHPYQYQHWFWSVFTYRRLNATQYYRAIAEARRKGVEPPVVEMNGQYFRLAEGEDAKRSLAFYGQSIGTGVLKEALIRLLADPTAEGYIGDAYFGRTPLRAPIHDSGLFEVPLVVWNAVLPRILREFTRPVVELPLPVEWGMGEYLSIGVAAKAGQDWMSMTAVGQETEADLTTAVEVEDAEDFEELARRVS